MAKYNNTKIRIDGMTFDSSDEGLYYKYLKEEKRKGNIKDFSCQPKFVLLEGYIKYGKKIRPMTYTPDFHIIYNDGREEYIDVKGMSTQASELRKKLFDYFYKDKTLKWIKRNEKYGKDGWIDIEDLKKIISNNKKKLKTKEK